MPLCDAFRIQSGIKPQEKLKILDLGIGTGLSVMPFAEEFDCHITGMDFSNGMLEECRRVFEGRGQDLTLMQANVTEPEPYQAIDNDSFDFVISAGLLEFVPPSGAKIIIDQAFRILKPAGMLAMIHYDAYFGASVPDTYRYTKSDMSQMCGAFNQIDLVPKSFVGYKSGLTNVRCGAFFGQKPEQP